MESTTPKNSSSSFWDFLKDRFNLEEGKASEKQTISEIEQGVVFRGANLWILIFAIMVASVGLNVNSTAVIIGAMLISPLMGPIMGIGLGVAINDFQLILKALKNLGIAVGISVITSALYFWISPLNDAQSELLARTSPTLWDVLIALFGGMAGIVAGSRKEKSNAIPGVAIATALMPPLCTAGFGLATSQWNYFFGAFYLFFINGVFISLSTYIFVILLRFKPKEFLDPLVKRRVKRSIAIFAIITIIPSIITGVQVVRSSFFNRNAQHFIRQEFNFEKTKVISKEIEFTGKQNKIEITLFGEPIPEETILQIEAKLPFYKLENTSLVTNQGYSSDDGVNLAVIEQMNAQLKAGIIEDLYRKNEELLKTKDAQIKFLENQILKMRSKEVPIMDIAKEVKTINPNVQELCVSQMVLSNVDSLKTDTIFLAYTQFRRSARKNEIDQLTEWLKVRVGTEKLRLVYDKR